MTADGGTGDLIAHEHTYSGFIGLFKWGAVAAFVIAAIVVFIIAS